MTLPVETDAVLESLLAGLPRDAHGPLTALDRLRAHAVDRVGALTVPTQADEDWRFTDLAPLWQQSFRPAWERPALRREDIAPFVIDGCPRLVFVDGMYAPELSDAAASDGITVANLPAGAGAHASLIEAHLGRHAGFEDRLFTAVNTACLRDGALVVARHRAPAAPVHLLFLSVRAGVASHPRSLVVAEPGSTLTVIEEYASLHANTALTNTVIEVAAGDGAQVLHFRLQREGAAAFHLARCAVTLARDSRYRSVAVTLGARLSRLEVDVAQAGPGADCSIDGLALVGGRQHADTYTSIDHAHPHGRSRQLHKCIAAGSAHAVFRGRIVVRREAQRTDSSQSSRNLLLGDRAVVDTQPQLEILADDVKCTHGATVGQLSADEVFYLRSRGLGEAAARNLLTFAFGAEVIGRIAVPALRSRVAQLVSRTLGRQP